MDEIKEPERITQYVVMSRCLSSCSSGSSDACQVTVPIASFKTADEAANHVRKLVMEDASSRCQGSFAYFSASSYFIWKMTQELPVAPSP
jgi:hypothetical protein